MTHLLLEHSCIRNAMPGALLLDKVNLSPCLSTVELLHDQADRIKIGTAGDETEVIQLSAADSIMTATVSTADHAQDDSAEIDCQVCAQRPIPNRSHRFGHRSVHDLHSYK